jgi:hypothetical protein
MYAIKLPPVIGDWRLPIGDLRFVIAQRDFAVDRDAWKIRTNSFASTSNPSRRFFS